MRLINVETDDLYRSRQVHGRLVSDGVTRRCWVVAVRHLDNTLLSDVFSN